MSSESGLPNGVTHQFDGEAERIVWHNRRLTSNNYLRLLHLLGFVIFLPLTLFLIIQLVSTQLPVGGRAADWSGSIVSLLFILLFGLIAVVTGQKLLSLTWYEEIEICDDRIFLRTKGVGTRREREIPVADIWRLSFEKYRHNQDQEFRYSVNIFHKRREQIAYWMGYEDGQQLYQLLAQIIDRRGWGGLIKTEEKGYEPVRR